MNRLPRYAIIVALTLGYAGLCPAVHSQTQSPKKALPCTVSGRVTVHGKGVSGIVVSIRYAEFSRQPQPSRKATTDQEGFYKITDIPAGNYEVQTLAPIYVSPDQSPLRGRGKSLLLAEGENVEGIDFSLVRGGVITGKVTDNDGRPVVEERLSLQPADTTPQAGQRVSPVVSNAFGTDDRGIYRIYGIPAGRYRVFVGQLDENYFSVGGPGRVPYRRTFYPDASDLNDARIVEVTEGGEVSDIDIRLGRSLPSFAASGKVVDGETGQPVSGLRVALRRILNQGYANNNQSVPTNSLGEFRVENVTSGKYSVEILPMQVSEKRADPVTFEIVDQDVTGIVVKASTGLIVNGTLVVDGKTDKSILTKITQLRLFAYVRKEGSPGFYGQSSPIGPDGSFRIGGLSLGTATFSLGSQDGGGPPTNFAILRVEHEGVEQPRGLEIKSSEQVSGVKIVLKYGTGSIRGEVKFENGPLPTGSRVSVWIRRADELTSNTSNGRLYSLDARGHFLIEGISAGNYELNVNANIQGSRKPPPLAKQAVIVTEGAVSEVAVTLVLAPSPEAQMP